MSDISFKDAFTENMQALGLPVPATLFDGVNAAVSNATLLVTAVQMLGAGATMAELATSFTTVVSGAGAAAVGTALLEIATVAGAVVAAFYVGAVIGSILVATWRSNVHELGQVLSWARQQCDRLGLQLSDLVRQVMDALGMRWNNLLQLVG
jgi:hypothetical protein